MTRLSPLLLLATLVTACASSLAAPPSPTPAPVGSSYRAVALPASVTVEDGVTIPPVATLRAGGPATEAEGEYVTSDHHSAKNYYRKSDDRWRDLKESNRVWFRTVEDLLATFPDRAPAP